MSYGVLFTMIRSYPALMIIPVLNIPIVNGVVLRLASSVIIDIPIYVIRKTTWNIFSRARTYFRPRIVETNIIADEQNVETGEVFSIDENFPEWQVLV